DRGLHLHEGAHQGRLALHREHAVRHEAERPEERGELIAELGRVLGRQRGEPRSGGAHLTCCSSNRRPPTIAVLASVALRITAFLNGSSTSQKRSSSVEASTVNTMRQPTPIAGCQLKSTSAQPTNSRV